MVKNRRSVDTERRGFLARIWMVLGGIVLLQGAAGSVLYFFSGRKSLEAESLPLLKTGLVSDFPPGSITYIAKGHFYLSRLDNGGFLAISRRCTHLGCAVPWVAERKRFECPCHASIFDATGMVLKSPAPRALDIFPVSFSRNMVLVDINAPIRRVSFQEDQPVFCPECA